MSQLISDPAIDDQLEAVRVGDGIVAVLRTDGRASTRSVDATATRIQRVSGDIPTGVRISETSSTNSSHRFTENGIYGQDRGLTVDIAPLVTTNTTARITTEPTRTVHAESNYWGSRRGPYHSSILPDGRGNPVVTNQGWVDFIPFQETPMDPEYTRPTAIIDAPTNSQPGTAVQLSGNGSISNQGSIVRYRYRIDGTAQPISDRPAYSIEMPDQRVEVELLVEDNFGIESNTTSVTIEPRAAMQSATPTAAPATRTATVTTTATAPESTPPPTDSDQTLLGSLSSIWGIFGGICYILAVAFGLYGMALTVTARMSPPISGLRVQGLAVLGILIWVIAGLLGSGPLLTVGLAAAVAWVVLTGAAYVVATRGLLDDVLG